MRAGKKVVRAKKLCRYLCLLSLRPRQPELIAGSRPPLGAQVLLVRLCLQHAVHLKVDLVWILPRVQASLHIRLGLSPLRTLKTSSPSRFHVSITYDLLSLDHLSPSTIPMIIVPDVTAPHLPVDRAGVGSGTEVERRITGTVDRDCGERYVLLVRS
jgi:hypothetical protein